MSAHKPAPGGTQDHRLPEMPPTGSVRPALVVAFPKPLALAIPAPKVPIGRQWLADSGIQDSEVSTHHLVFSRASGELFVEDVGSRNGTWLDGHLLAQGERAALSDGALLRVGRTLLIYREQLEGDLLPAPPIGEMVGPFGLRAVASALAGFRLIQPQNILIEGQTGTGKELAAAAVAQALGRGRPYAAVNVAGVAPTVFESQLFGHVAGAFSDAGRGSRGIVVAHAGGTVFLDEIGELPLDLQPKLLRLLENREVLPVGADRPVPVELLFVAATNRSLEEMVEQGRFRRDLYARLAMAKIELPPLRERAEDIFAMAQALAARRGVALMAENVEVEAMERLLLDAWPNNIRGFIATLDRIRAMDPAPGLRFWSVQKVMGAGVISRTGQLTVELVQAAIQATGGNETEAARRLGVTRGKLRRFLAAHTGSIK